MFVYLDNSATTKPHPDVVSAMTDVLSENFGNPSSLYTLGISAEKLMNGARRTIAASINARPEEVYFTSGGTESDNTVLCGVWNSRRKQGKRIITTSVEHPAILRTCEYLEKQGADVVYVPVLPDGCIDMDAFKAALTNDTILVSVMHVNNESGAIMPIADIRKAMDAVSPDMLLHTDAVQSYEKLDTDVKALGVDFMSMSGHKINGPKGIGVLYAKKGIHIPAFVLGGGQEKGFRSGTENMPGIVGMGKAVELKEKEKDTGRVKMDVVKAYLLSLIMQRIPDIKINTPVDSAPSVLNISFIGCRGEVLLHMLEQDEIYVSTGSACSSKKNGSHVLAAMGLTQQEIEGALRFSFSSDNTKEQMDFVAEKLSKAVESQRRLRGAFKSNKSC